MKKLLLISFVLLSLSACTQKEEKTEKTEKQPVEGEVSQDLKSLRLANELVKYGYEENSALSMINALQIYANVQTQELEAKKEGDVAEKDSTLSFDFDQVAKDAKTFADGNETFLSLIDEVVALNESSHRGAVGGPQRHVDVVRASSRDDYACNFKANQLAEVALSGDGDTDLDLYVYDSNGHLIGCDEDYTDDCYVRWVPKWTGKFIIRVVNNGGVANRYIILTN